MKYSFIPILTLPLPCPSKYKVLPILRTGLVLLGIQEKVRLFPLWIAVASAGRPSALILSASPFSSVAERVYWNNEFNVKLNTASSTLKVGAMFSKTNK